MVHTYSTVLTQITETESFKDERMGDSPETVQFNSLDDHIPLDPKVLLNPPIELNINVNIFMM